MSKRSVRWFFNISKWEPTSHEIFLATSCIQPEEKERLGRFVFKKDFKSSLIGRLMMRKFISEAHDRPYNEIKFNRDSKGKPFLHDTADLPKVEFSVSHQGDFTILAGHIGEINLGADVMKLEYTGGKSLSEFFRIMTRNFAPQEWDTIKSANNELKQIAMFCRHWCLKESYVKALGVGITTNLQDIVFKVHTKELKLDTIVKDTELYVQGEKVKWEFQESLINDDHCVAVAMSCKNTEQTMFEELSFDHLMQNAVPLINRDEDYCMKYFSKLEKA